QHEAQDANLHIDCLPRKPTLLARLLVSAHVLSLDLENGFRAKEVDERLHTFTFKLDRALRHMRLTLFGKDPSCITKRHSPEIPSELGWSLSLLNFSHLLFFKCRRLTSVRCVQSLAIADPINRRVHVPVHTAFVDHTVNPSSYSSPYSRPSAAFRPTCPTRS